MLYLTFDTETTGTDFTKDQIIEICIQTGFEDKSDVKTRRIKPTIKIPKEATAIHGITNEDVKDCPTFKQLGKGIKEVFDKADVIIGYNVLFDIKMLQSEFVRNKLEPINFNSKHILDPLSIWRKLKPRKLENAYKEFCGKDLINAHSAEADVRATAEIYTSMLKVFNLEDRELKELSAYTIPPNWIGLSDHIVWENKTPAFNFGKHKGKSVWKVINSESSYLDWMKANNFLPHVIEICENAQEASNEKDFIESIVPNKSL